MLCRLINHHFLNHLKIVENPILSWAGERITTHELEDSMGPAPFRKDCDSIICTPETLGNCQLINEIRLKNGLVPLEIIEAPHALDEVGWNNFKHEDTCWNNRY